MGKQIQLLLHYVLYNAHAERIEKLSYFRQERGEIAILFSYSLHNTNQTVFQVECINWGIGI